MKEIFAIIRQNKMSETKTALTAAGIYSLTATKVLGRGKGGVDFRVLQGAEDGHEEAISQLGQGPRLIPKRMLLLVLPDDKVSVAVETIIKANRTGKPGDGRIFVLPTLDACRVRTGETGDLALNEEN